jgi:hypothetical protein
MEQAALTAHLVLTEAQELMEAQALQV